MNPLSTDRAIITTVTAIALPIAIFVAVSVVKKTIQGLWQVAKNTCCKERRIKEIVAKAPADITAIIAKNDLGVTAANNALNAWILNTKDERWQAKLMEKRGETQALQRQLTAAQARIAGPDGLGQLL